MKAIRMMLGVLALTVAAQAHAGSVVVSAASKAGAMGGEAVKRVFMGREPSVGGAPVQVVYQKGGPTRAGFDQGVLGKSGAELTTYWSRLIFTGKAKAPTEVDSDTAVKAKLAANPGAIGYVSDAAVDSSMRVIFKF